MGEECKMEYIDGKVILEHELFNDERVKDIIKSMDVRRISDTRIEIDTDNVQLLVEIGKVLTSKMGWVSNLYGLEYKVEGSEIISEFLTFFTDIKEGVIFENDVFVALPYMDVMDDGSLQGYIVKPPMFIHKKSGFMMSWYKNFKLVKFNHNYCASLDELDKFYDIIRECYESIDIEKRKEINKKFSIYKCDSYLYEKYGEDYRKNTIRYDYVISDNIKIVDDELILDYPFDDKRFVFHYELFQYLDIGVNLKRKEKLSEVKNEKGK